MKASAASRYTSIVAGIGLCVAVAQADAAVIYDNLSASSSGADGVSAEIGFGSLYDSFSTGTSGFGLNQIQVLLGGNPDAGALQVSLLSDNNIAPGLFLANIGTVSDSQLSSTLAVFTFTLSAPILLAANTRYWVELSDNASTPTSAVWSWSFDTSGVGVAGEYFANSCCISANPGNGPYQMSVSGSVPEPSTWAMMLIGFAGIGVAAYRRSKRASAKIAAA